MSKDGNKPNKVRRGDILAGFRRDRRGVTGIEYALIGSMVGIAIIVGVSTVGSTLATNFYDTYADKLDGTSAGP